MEVIVNPKTLDNGVNVIQLETAVGAAMKCFEGSIGKGIHRLSMAKESNVPELLIYIIA